MEYQTRLQKILETAPWLRPVDQEFVNELAADLINSGDLPDWGDMYVMTANTGAVYVSDKPPVKTQMVDGEDYIPVMLNVPSTWNYLHEKYLPSEKFRKHDKPYAFLGVYPPFLSPTEWWLITNIEEVSCADAGTE